MLQFSPGEYIPVVRQLEDPTDSTTRYVRAYIYKYKGSGTGTLLDTVNLEDKTGQRFEYLYQTPQDSDPYTLEIIIKVFDDSGYTTESNRYERSYQTYLVAVRWGMMYRGGGGADVNYDKVRRIIQEEIDKIPKTIVPTPEKVDFRPLLGALKEVNQSVKNIRMPEQEKVDFSPMIRAIENVQREVKAIKMPEPEKVNLLPILNGLKAITEEFLDSINSAFKDRQEDIVEKFEDLKKEISSITFVRLRTEEDRPKGKKRKLFL